MSSSNDSGERVIAGGLALALVLLLLLAWLLSRYLKTVSQATAADPRNKAIWLPAAAAVLCLIAGVALNANPVLLTLAVLCASFLWLASYVICIRSHDRFERPWSVSDVYRVHTWWQAA